MKETICVSDDWLDSTSMYLSVLVQPALKSLCICFSFAERTKVLFTLFQPGAQTSMFLEEFCQLIFQRLRLPQTVLQDKRYRRGSQLPQGLTPPSPVQPQVATEQKRYSLTVHILCMENSILFIHIFILLVPGSSAVCPGAEPAAGPGQP